MSTLNVNNINEAGGVDAVIASGVLDSGSLPAGSILQVVSTTKTDTFSMTGGTYSDITGLSVSITPSSISNKIYVVCNVNVGVSGTDILGLRLLRDATEIGSGDAAGSRGTGFAGPRPANADVMHAHGLNYLDSPSSTSSLTYQVQMKVGSTNTAYVNRSSNDTDIAAFMRVSSQITLMEVAG